MTANRDSPANGDQPTVQQIAHALEWALNTQPRRRREGDEHDEVIKLNLVVSVAAELAASGADSTDLEVLKVTAIRLLESRLDRLPTADQDVAEILLAAHSPISGRMDDLGERVGSSKALAVRDQVIYRMAAVLLGRDPVDVEPPTGESEALQSRRFRIGAAIGVASLLVGVAALLLAVYADFFRSSDSAAGETPLGFELSVATCDVARTCNSEATAANASVSGFAPGGFADVEILAPSGQDANDLPAAYAYRTPLEVDDSGSFLWQYWWDPPMELGAYQITVTDRETGQTASSTLEFTESETTTTTATSTSTPPPLVAIVLGDVDLNVRAGPTTQSDIVATAELGSSVTILCYTRGETVTLDSNDQGNDLWHLITTSSPSTVEGFATDVFLNTPTGAEPLDGEPPCPVPGDPPEGDLFLRLRPDNRLGEDLQPGQTLVVELEIARAGWIVLDLDCTNERNPYPQLDGALTVTAHTDPVYWHPPNPVTNCNTDLIQGPVAPGNSYYYTIQLADADPSRVVVLARFVNPPIEDTFDGRVVLPQIDIRRTDSVTNTLTSGTVHAYTYVLTTRDRLQFAFDCNEQNPPTETPLRVRGINQQGVEYFDQAIDTCVPWRAPAPPVDGRYEIQVLAEDRDAEAFYRLAALIQD